MSVNIEVFYAKAIKLKLKAHIMALYIETTFENYDTFLLEPLDKIMFAIYINLCPYRDIHGFPFGESKKNASNKLCIELC